MKKSQVSTLKQTQYRFSGKPLSLEQARLVPGGNNGFTVKELIMALVVIGVLCGLAVPQYYAMRNAKGNIQILQKNKSEIKKTHGKNIRDFLPFSKKKSP